MQVSISCYNKKLKNSIWLVSSQKNGVEKNVAEKKKQLAYSAGLNP